MPTYTAPMVEKLLRNYLDIRYTLEGRGQILPDTYAVRTAARNTDDVPLGQTARGQPWPFMEKARAKAPMDGKRRARLIEELHVACIDIEDALRKLTDDDLELLYDYHIFQNKTLDELVAARGVTSRGSMQKRIYRAVQRLTYAMEHP